MPQSFTSLYFHLVFSTKQRQPLLDADLRPRLFEYIGGILRGRGGTLISAGGTADHVHLLALVAKTRSIVDTLRDVKANSSGWIHEEFPDRKCFAWQAGYGAFTVSYSAIDDVKHYLAIQEEHHQVRSFQEEFRGILRRHELEWDERYVWD